MIHDDDEKTLTEAGVRVTAVRLLVWREIRSRFNDAFSLADLEDALPTVDRSTLFRTLSLLVEAHLLHDIDDGSGKQKYCVCPMCDTLHCGGHVHVTCTHCRRTFCLTDVPIPAVPLPAGFHPEQAEYVIKGICPNCARHLMPA